MNLLPNNLLKETLISKAALISKAVLIGCALSIFSISTMANENEYLVVAQTEYWRAAPSGSLFGDQAQNLNLSELDSGREYQTSVGLRIEHPLNYIPNIRVVTYNIEYTSQSQLSTDLILNSQDFSSGDRVNTEIDLSHVEINAYYNFLQNDLSKKGISIELGIAVKKMEGELALQSTDRLYFKSIGETLPLLSIFTKINLPNPNWRLEHLFTGTSFEANTSYDIKTKLNYQYEQLFEIFLGYRNFRLEISGEDDLTLDVRSKGPFLGAQFFL